MHLALLRGINVGGSNVIRMRDLVQAFEDMGFGDVRTYIQSGNVLFEADRASTQSLVDQIETELSRRFDYAARVVVKSRRQYQTALERAPVGWGTDPSRKHNAIFVGSDVRASSVLKQLPPLRDDLETATRAPGVIFWSASIEGLSRTTMMKLARLPVYGQVTVRNHKTTLKIAEMLAP